MSNHVAIAAVTSTLAEMLNTPLDADVTGARAVPGRPDQGDDQDPRVRIFLYQVAPNAAWRNEDLPTRRSSGELVQRPQVALNLHYLMSFFGDEVQLVPQRLLASTVRALYTCPLITRQAIRRTIATALATDPDHFLGEANLADQPELVRFTPLPLDLDALSKLWSVFFQVPYRLSVAYEASVVLISPDESPSAPLPVRERRIFVFPFRRPTIAKIVLAADARGPITAGSTIRIVGSQLKGEITRVRLGADVVVPSPDSIQDEEIRLVLPATLRPGLIGAQVLHAMLMGEPPQTRSAGESNVAPFVLHPRIREGGGTFQISVTDPAVDPDGLHAGNLVVEVDLPVGQRQRVVAHLVQRAPTVGAPASYNFPDPSRDVEGEPETTSTLIVPFAGVEAGTYLVRLHVDGAESLLVPDLDETSPTFGQYIAPSVTIS